MTKLLKNTNIYRILDYVSDRLASDNIHLTLVCTGGVVMMMKYKSRESTRDIDCRLMEEDYFYDLMDIAEDAAEMFDLFWTERVKWLGTDVNDVYPLKTISKEILYHSPGLTLHPVEPIEMLLHKLDGFRSQIDIDDAKVILEHMNLHNFDDAMSVLQHGLQRGIVISESLETIKLRLQTLLSSMQ